MKVIRIKAVEGRRVRDPNTEQPLTHEAHGARKPLSSYWQRRLAGGDVVEVKTSSPDVVIAMDIVDGEVMPAEVGRDVGEALDSATVESDKLSDSAGPAERR